MGDELGGVPKRFCKSKILERRKYGRTRLLFVMIKNLCVIMVVINGGTI